MLLLGLALALALDTPPSTPPSTAPSTSDAPAAPAGDAKAGDAKAGDAKAGDAKAGDAKAGDAKAGEANGAAEVTPVVSEPTPRVIDPAAEADAPPSFVSDDALEKMAATDITAARPLLRRSARSAEQPATRALALRLLATDDAGTATARICARALRIDIEASVRRAAAECLGRLGPDIGGQHTAPLVAALKDGNLDVVTMAGWALANVGDAASIGAIAAATHHPDERVARLFLGYAERMRARLGLVYEAQPEETIEHDAQGRRLVPPGIVLVTQAHGLDLAASTGWLGLYGGVVGWYHGAYLLSAHGGSSGAEAAALGGLGGAAIGAAAASAYAFTRADTLPLAHTVVQLGTLGTFAGFGAGLVSGFPPNSAVAAANLSFVGTLAGTAAGIALVEERPPTLGALGVGIVAGLTLGTATGAVWRGYGLRDDSAIGAALLVGSLAGGAGTIATANLDVGLFPLSGGALGGMVGAGVGSVVFFLAEPQGFTEETGWGIAGLTLAGAALGAAGGLALPREIDPLLNKELELFPPAIAALPSMKGGDPVPAVLLAGRF